MGKTSLIKFQIGPVQDFIAAARSTRDLWGGSYLLSFLVAAGIRRLVEEGGSLIFPAADKEGNQPLLKNPNTWSAEVLKDLLTPNLPNLFVADVPEENAVAIAKSVKAAIEGEWQKIAASVWDHLVAGDFAISRKEEFRAQADRHLEISWLITPLSSDYAGSFSDNGKHLDAVRQTRDFRAWGSGMVNVGAEKDTLNGRDTSLASGKQLAKGMHGHLFKHPGDHLGAIAIIKRLWHITYLEKVCQLPNLSEKFKIPSIPAIAAREIKTDDAASQAEDTLGERYIAAIAFDGDSIGAWVSGGKLPDAADLLTHHGDFSAALGRFALGRARSIVEGDVDGENKGFLIYAGGDDVVALVPADIAVSVAEKLRTAFTEECGNIGPAKDGTRPDASAGIVIAHVKSPLQDLIREARIAEKRAKDIIGRPAFSVSLMKRSGEISHWGAKWDSGGIALHEMIAEAMRNEQLSAKFPHRVCQLLTPYQARISDAEGFDAEPVITREFETAISRQSTSKLTKETRESLHTALAKYLKSVSENFDGSGDRTLPQTLLSAVTGLCISVAFSNRTSSSIPAEKQTAAP